MQGVVQLREPTREMLVLLDLERSAALSDVIVLVLGDWVGNCISNHCRHRINFVRHAMHMVGDCISRGGCMHLGPMVLKSAHSAKSGLCGAAIESSVGQ